MKSVKFVLPTLPGTDMSKNDQGALLVNQATALIVAAYLEHATNVYNTEMGQSHFSEAAKYAFEPSELHNLIDVVQDSLKSFT